ncbi:uncharacterized protein LOC124168718 [Ischnura elegans]|uniref:uncharacterized protein LOC124168718 n=1 Tax=Ischnura elegans TaxID=197161 RepID=UPI001ED87ADB|nr:uncharacterized protein LOC124168718 [Ischnura elegans]
MTPTPQRFRKTMGGAGGGDEGDGGGSGDGDGEGGSSTPASPSASAEAEARRKALANRVRQVLSSGPLLAQAEVSSSQLDFFKMLDERIENGPDYVSGSDDDVLSVPERQSSLPEDEQHSCCNLETQSLTLSHDADSAQGTPVSAVGKRAVTLAASAPSPGDAVKSPVMNGELRRWDGPQTAADARQGNGIDRSGNVSTPSRGKMAPKSNT